MKVLLSAYACEPGRGSEPEAGLRALLAAATVHDVWLLTRANNVEPLQDLLAHHPARARIRIVGLEADALSRRLKQSGNLALHWYYDRWQRVAGIRARELDREVGFDLVHHATFAAYWTRVGVTSLRKPLVLGPIGGGVATPATLMRELGFRGMVAEIVRDTLRHWSARRSSVRAAHRVARVVLVQNHETIARCSGEIQPWILPNALAVEDIDVAAAQPRSTEIVFVGRLIAWKAPLLALRALKYVSNPAATLRFFGAGPERQRLGSAARRWDLADRVSFAGPTSRVELLARLKSAAVLLHPSLREEAGFAVAEALALGTPVVALDHGGPRELVRRWPGSPSMLIPPDTAERTAQHMAAAIDRFLAAPASIPNALQHPDCSFESELLKAYACAARRS